jgi:photosystem II stability/assembly factor-like uncharacterized protein
MRERERGFSNNDAIRGAGVFWTSGNSKWAQIPATSGYQAVNRVAILADGKVLLAATPEGLFRSADKSRATWEPVLSDGIADVRFHPKDPKLAVAGGLWSGRAYYSTDRGQTWKPSSHNQPRGRRVELTYAVKDPRIVYASVDLNSGSIWRSQDGGRNYQLMDTLTPGDEPGAICRQITLATRAGTATRSGPATREMRIYCSSEGLICGVAVTEAIH